MPLRVHTDTDSGRTVVMLPAEVDITNIEDLRAQVSAQVWDSLPQLSEVVFDLTGTTFLGTEAAHLIRDTRRRGHDCGVAVYVVCLTPLHRRVLDCLGLGPDTVPLAHRRPVRGSGRAWLPRQRGSER